MHVVSMVHPGHRLQCKIPNRANHKVLVTGPGVRSEVKSTVSDTQMPNVTSYDKDKILWLIRSGNALV